MPVVTSIAVVSLAFTFFFSPLPGAAFNTALVTAVVMVLTIFTTSMCAYALARLDFPGKQAILFALLVTLLIPGEMLIIPTFYVNRSLHLVGDGKA